MERLYITQIVKRHVRNMFDIDHSTAQADSDNPGSFPLRVGMFGKANVTETSTEYSELIKALGHVLHCCQEFMRKQTDECSFVSLRDVERTLQVFRWVVFVNCRTSQFERDRASLPFFEMVDRHLFETGEMTKFNDPLRAIIIAIAVCYHCSLQEKRIDFRKYLAKEAFVYMPLKLPRVEMLQQPAAGTGAAARMEKANETARQTNLPPKDERSRSLAIAFCSKSSACRTCSCRTARTN